MTLGKSQMKNLFSCLASDNNPQVRLGKWSPMVILGIGVASWGLLGERLELYHLLYLPDLTSATGHFPHRVCVDGFETRAF